MKFAILAVVAAVAVAAPQYGYPAPPTTPPPTTPPPTTTAPPLRTPGYSYPEPQNTYLTPNGGRDAGTEEVPEEPKENIPILRDERVNNEDGTYSVDVETGDGIKASEAGSLDGEGNAVKSGQYSYTAPDGSLIEVKYVADANGFQAQSDAIPVPPEFPHEIPDFVLEQIKFAQEEDARAAAEAEAAARSDAPSNLYGSPRTDPPPPPTLYQNPQ